MLPSLEFKVKRLIDDGIVSPDHEKDTVLPQFGV